MKTHKTKIFNSEININYEENDKDKLLHLIEKLKLRLNKFNHLNGKVTDTKILILAALSIEDELLEKKQILSEENNLKDNFNKSELQIEKLSKEIIVLKDKINFLESKLDQKNNSELLIEKEIDNINTQIKTINDLMLSEYDE